MMEITLVVAMLVQSFRFHSPPVFASNPGRCSPASALLRPAHDSRAREMRGVKLLPPNQLHESHRDIFAVTISINRHLDLQFSQTSSVPSGSDLTANCYKRHNMRSRDYSYKVIASDAKPPDVKWLSYQGRNRWRSRHRTCRRIFRSITSSCPGYDR